MVSAVSIKAQEKAKFQLHSIDLKTGFYSSSYDEDVSFLFGLNGDIKKEKILYSLDINVARGFSLFSGRSDDYYQINALIGQEQQGKSLFIKYQAGLGYIKKQGNNTEGGFMCGGFFGPCDTEDHRPFTSYSTIGFVLNLESGFYIKNRVGMSMNIQFSFNQKEMTKGISPTLSYKF